MVTRTLYQIYKQYPCSVLSLFAVLYETRFYQYNYFWYYRPIHFQGKNITNEKKKIYAAINISIKE